MSPTQAAPLPQTPQCNPAMTAMISMEAKAVSTEDTAISTGSHSHSHSHREGTVSKRLTFRMCIQSNFPTFTYVSVAIARQGKASSRFGGCVRLSLLLYTYSIALLIISLIFYVAEKITAVLQMSRGYWYTGTVHSMSGWAPAVSISVIRKRPKDFFLCAFSVCYLVYLVYHTVNYSKILHLGL